MAEKIIIGPSRFNPLLVFENPTIKTCECVLSSSMTGDQIAIDEFRPVVYSGVYITGAFVPKRSDGLITADGKKFIVKHGGIYPDKIPYGTPVWYFNNNKLVGKFYTQEATRTGKALFSIVAVSALGVMDGQQHLGGLYTGQTFREVAAEIIGGSFKFTADDDVANTAIYGWLPIASKRENLHQLLFAYGVKMGKTETGTVHFSFPNALMEKEVPDNRIFLGGTVSYKTPATKVEVTEHSYVALPGDIEVTLFDNTSEEFADNVFVSFRDAPIYDLTVTGTLEVISSGVNWAIVSGVGTLAGKMYSHTTRVSTRSRGKINPEKVVSITDATLVSVVNSRNVAKRVLSYYGSAKTVTADIIVDRERPGDRIVFNDPYNEKTTAFIESMEMNASSFLRASCELISGFTPVGQGNNYSSYRVLTGSGTYKFPAGTESAVVVLISEGDGGASGGKGHDATGSLIEDVGEGGAGGVKGTGGQGGRILVVSLETPTGSFSYRCGSGQGVGGVPADDYAEIFGGVGAETTFGQYTTASGLRSENGYVNLFTGEVYALPGSDGIPGGNGASEMSEGTDVFYNGKTYRPGKQGTSAEDSNLHGSVFGDGGYGGGAAAGNHGGDGGNGEARMDGQSGRGIGGYGGDGATPVSGENATQYGCGGHGGHGGGGGGGGGSGSGTIDGGGRKNGTPGNGAIGSPGGNAAPGCILIYL